MGRVNEYGRSMIEMLGVLAIVGVLSVGGIAGYSKAMTKFKANKLIDQITTISMNIRTLFANERDYSSVTPANVVKLGVLPREMYEDTDVSGSNIIHAFGGNAEVHYVFGRTVGHYDYFAVRMKSLPKDACVVVLTTDFGSDAVVAMGIHREPATMIVINGGVLEASDDVAVPGDANYPAPMSVVMAQNACQSIRDDEYVFVMFR